MKMEKKGAKWVKTFDGVYCDGFRRGFRIREGGKGRRKKSMKEKLELSKGKSQPEDHAEVAQNTQEKRKESAEWPAQATRYTNSNGQGYLFLTKTGIQGGKAEMEGGGIQKTNA